MAGGSPPAVARMRWAVLLGVLVVCLMRKNVTQEFVGAIFGFSQATVSRRWLLLPLTEQVFA